MFGLDASDDLDAMVEHRTVEQMEVAVGGPGFCIRCAVDHSIESGVHHRTRAHRTRFERHVQRALVQPPGADLCRRVLNGENFGVGHRITGELALVVPRRDHSTLVDNNCADGNVVVLLCSLGLLDRELHPHIVRRTRRI